MRAGPAHRKTRRRTAICHVRLPPDSTWPTTNLAPNRRARRRNRRGPTVRGAPTLPCRALVPPRLVTRTRSHGPKAAGRGLARTDQPSPPGPWARQTRSCSARVRIGRKAIARPHLRRDRGAYRRRHRHRVAARPAKCRSHRTPPLAPRSHLHRRHGRLLRPRRRWPYRRCRWRPRRRARHGRHAHQRRPALRP